jgi:hypothetical protein
MKKTVYSIFLYALTCVFSISAFAQPLNMALHGQWFLNNESPTLSLSAKEFKFIYSVNTDEVSFSWINLPPQDGTPPEALVSEDGFYNVCFYEGSTVSRGALLTELSDEMLQFIKLKKDGELSQERFNEEIDSMSKSLKIINNLSDKKFSAIVCKQLAYSTESKKYEELGSGDVVYYFFYDQNVIHQWTKNFTMGGVSIETYSRK